MKDTTRGNTMSRKSMVSAVLPGREGNSVRGRHRESLNVGEGSEVIAG